VSITATELEILKIINEKNSLISIKELSSKARFEIVYTLHIYYISRWRNMVV